jgi:CelD/BcsL family acetyltransferase involved in cellulose biosynthesis
VLTALMIRCLLEEGATELDFGRGDDPYKKLWADSRRQRTGIVLAKPSTLKGATTIARHEAGRFTEKIKSLFVSFSSEKERIFFLERKKQRTFKSGAGLSGRAPSLPSA